MYTDTITVFNKKKTESGDIWHPCVLRGVNLIIDRVANQAKTGLENADTAKLFVQYQNIDGRMMIADRGYYPPKEWAALDKEEKTITFVDGVSFFIRGEYPENPVSDEAYRDGLHSYLNKVMDDCYRVTSVGGPYKMIPHFEIGGR